MTDHSDSYGTEAGSDAATDPGVLAGGIGAGPALLAEDPASDTSPADALAVQADSGADEDAGFLRDTWSVLRRRPTFLIAAFFVLLMLLIAAAPMLFAGWFGHGDPRACDLSDSAGGPTGGHPFGFDKQGCDVYANVIYGARASISIGLLVTALSVILALLLGSTSGYYGRAVDAVISRITDVFFGFPFVLGALVILTSFHVRSVLSVSMVIALFTWPVLTRLMRSSVLSVKHADYVIAARGLGAGDWRILRRHVIPNAITPVIVIAAITVGSVIAAESTLTFLGVGLQQPAISWGLQLSNAQTEFQTNPHLLLFPAAFLAVTVLSFIVLGDALQDALDPRSR